MEQPSTGGRMEVGGRSLVLRSKSSRVYPVRNDTGQAKPLREGRKYTQTASAAVPPRTLRRCGEKK